MIIVSNVNDITIGYNLNAINRFSVFNDQVLNYDLNIVIVQEEDANKALERFNDILEAATEDQKIYDARKEVGYWKAPKTAAKKPGPKPKAKEPASREHHEPAPKK